MDKIYETLKMEDITAIHDAAEIEKDKALAIVAFIFWFLFFLPAVASKDSRYAKAVSNQAFTLLLMIIAIGIAGVILAFIPVLGALLVLVIRLAYFALIVLKIVDAAQGRIRKLPFGFEVEIFK